MKFVLTDWLSRNAPAPIVTFFGRKDVQAVIEWVKEPFYAVALMFALTTIIAQPFYVPSGSMEPSLAIGDAVLAAKFPYGYTRYSMPFVNGPTPEKKLFGRLPTVGDVVVFRLPRDTKVTYVKRVIGLPGDIVEARDGQVYINGKLLNEPYLPPGTRTDCASFVNPCFLPGPIPPDHYWVMGDNRSESKDSRYFKAIPKSDIIGRAFIRIWPLNRLDLL